MPFIDVLPGQSVYVGVKVKSREDGKEYTTVSSLKYMLIESSQGTCHVENLRPTDTIKRNPEDWQIWEEDKKPR
jgi:hypothetical protein